MKIDIATQNFELTNRIKKHIEKKFTKLDKFKSDFHLKVNLSMIKNYCKVHAILSSGSEIYQATEEKYENIYKSINKVFGKIKKPLRRSRKGIWHRLLKNKLFKKKY